MEDLVLFCAVFGIGFEELNEQTKGHLNCKKVSV